MEHNVKSPHFFWILIGLARTHLYPVTSLSWGKIVAGNDTREIKKSTTIFHGLRSYTLYAPMLKTQVEPRVAGEWFHCKVFNILWRNFYGL